MQWLKQSTVVSKIVGPVLDSAGVEYASAVIGDLSLSKNGATLTALAATATLTYIANGYYTLALTTGNTDTLGSAEITCNKSTYQMPPREFMVLPATVYDALVTNAVNTTGGLPAATGAISALAGAISTLTQTQVSGGAYALNNASFAFSAALDFTTAQKAATLARVTLTDTVTTYTGNTPQTGDSFARIGANGAGLTGIVLPAGGLANVTAWSVALTGNITGNVSGSVGSVTAGVTLAANQDVRNVSGTVATVTTLTNLPSIPANWITSAGINAAALNGKGDWFTAAGYTAPNNAGIASIVAKLPANAIADETLVIAATSAILSAVGTLPNLSQILAGGDVDGFTLEQALKLILALAGKVSGAGTGTEVFRAADDSVARITATVDGNGNRTAVVFNAAG